MSRRNVTRLCVALAALAGVAAAAQPARAAAPAARCTELTWRTGDDPAWAAPDHDDATWDTSAHVPHTTAIRWIRCRVAVSGALTRPLAVYVSLLGSHELFWDGVPLGASGVVGATAEDELPGQLLSLHPVPDDLAGRGQHVLALRTSSHHAGFAPTTYFYAVGVTDMATWTARPSGPIILPLLCLGALVFAGLYFLLLFAIDPDDRSQLLLGLLGVATAAQLIAETWRPLFGYSYDLHIVRLRAIAGFAWLSGVLLVGFLVVRFRQPHSRRWIAGVAIVATALALALPGYDLKTTSVLLAALGAALCVALHAAARRRPGAKLATIGVAFCLALLVWEPGLFLDVSLYYGMAGLLLCLLVTQVRQILRQRRDHDAALVRSLRLELELVKKQIQPHFLLNSLTSVIELIEQEPDAAVTMVEALAVELRSLLSVASETAIAMEQELALCRAHLAVMSLRRDRRFELRAEDVTMSREVPPAVILTLVENAVTHGQFSESAIELRLREHTDGDQVTYVFESPLGDAEPSPVTKGTGLRYVEARMRERFGDDYELTFGPVGNVWQTTLRVTARAGP